MSIDPEMKPYGSRKLSLLHTTAFNSVLGGLDIHEVVHYHWDRDLEETTGVTVIALASEDNAARIARDLNAYEELLSRLAFKAPMDTQQLQTEIVAASARDGAAKKSGRMSNGRKDKR